MLTNTMTNAVTAALDRFAANLDDDGPGAAILALCRHLAVQRSGMPPDEWRACCAAAAGHPALTVLAEDPYVHDARAKPSGYAGDARLLDFIYRRETGTRPVSPLGRQLFTVSTAVPLGSAVRERSRLLAGAVADLVATSPGADIVSVACGHARELDLLPPGTIDRLRYWGMDQDTRSLETARHRHPGAVFEPGSVRGLIQGTLRLPEADLVYASGLFDYLNDRVATILLKRMWTAVRAGGALLIPNLSPGWDEIPFMEAVMDWWMEYRDEAAMRRLAGSVSFPGASRIDTWTTSAGMVSWLRVVRATGCSGSDRRS
jgi:trans-aconitate methyltransferase